MTPPAWHLLLEHYEGSNIANDPGLYEIENESADPDGTVEVAMNRIAP